MNMNSCSCQENLAVKPADIQDLSRMLKLVCEPNRLHVLSILKDGGEHCVCEFNSHMGDVSQSLLSHHLADLKEAGLVDSHKQGLKVYYALTDKGARIVKTVYKLIDMG